MSSLRAPSAPDEILRAAPTAPEARPLFEALAAEYSRRYAAHRPASDAEEEMLRYPPEAFAPPLGDFLLIRRGGETVAGGAFMSHDDDTAEIKRIWTRGDLRRQGLARRIVLALEESAAALGYGRAYLTTGFLQPEAVGLYLSLGYRPLFDPAADPKLYRSLPFEKRLGARAGAAAETPPRPPAASFEEASAFVAALKAGQERKILARLALWRTSAAASV